jgi:hypothetical protein
VHAGICAGGSPSPHGEGLSLPRLLDADIRDFFTSLDHSWLVKFIEHRIADKRVLRLIQKWLKAGVVEDGKWSETPEGTPQGASVSTLLANVYLHYVFDQWVRQWRQRYARGDMIVVRFADDIVMGFRHRDDVERFWADLRERFAQFNLELNDDKTRLIEFGRFAARDREAQGLRKPETQGRAGARWRRCRRSVSPTRPPNPACIFLCTGLSTGHALAGADAGLGNGGLRPGGGPSCFVGRRPR